KSGATMTASRMPASIRPSHQRASFDSIGNDPSAAPVVLGAGFRPDERDSVDYLIPAPERGQDRRERIANILARSGGQGWRRSVDCSLLLPATSPVLQ